MGQQSHFPKLPGQKWRRCPSAAVRSLWAPLTCCSVTGSPCRPHRIPNIQPSCTNPCSCFCTLSGKKWRVAPSSCHWSHWATVTLWRCASRFHSLWFSSPLSKHPATLHELLSSCSTLSGQKWGLAPSSCRWSPWATVTLWSGASPILCLLSPNAE